MTRYPKKHIKDEEGRENPQFLNSSLSSYFLFSSFSMNLNIFSWNYKGLSNSHTMDHIHSIMANKKPDFLFLAETKVTIPRVYRFYDKIKMC